MMTSTLQGATTGMVFLGAYDQALEQELGKEKATSIQENVMKLIGQNHAKMVKDQTGMQDFDLEALNAIIPQIMDENMGIKFEAIEKTPGKVVYNVGRCPVYESSAMLGIIDPATAQSRCKATALVYMNALLNELNPKVSLELQSFRHGPNEHCVESFVLSE